MTLADQGLPGSSPDILAERRAMQTATRPTQQQQQGRMQAWSQPTNVGNNERAVSVASGAIAAFLGLRRGDLPGLLIAGIGGALVYRGATGRCPMYSSLGMSTADLAGPGSRLESKGLVLTQSFLVNRPPNELYDYWRNFENLPRIMTYLEAVRVTDDRRSHWIAQAPSIAGGKVEWDAEITDDTPNERIAWRSLPGADVDNAGEVQFVPSAGDRGTAVRVTLQYLPPAGRVGKWIATLFGDNPERQVREDLRNFKRVMETGEVPTTSGQPHGTCTGKGTRSA